MLRRHFLECTLLALTGYWTPPVKIVDGTNSVSSRKSVVQFTVPKTVFSSFSGKTVSVVYVRIPEGQEVEFWNEIMSHVMAGKPAPEKLRKIYAGYAEYSSSRGKTACDVSFFVNHMIPAIQKSDKFVFVPQEDEKQTKPGPSNDELLRDHLKDDPQYRRDFFGAS